MKVFIAGSRSIQHLDAAAQRRITSICEKGFDILIGDCYGVDTAVQHFCCGHDYRNVTVYASNGKIRNNIGAWAVKAIPTDSSLRGFNFYRQKDIAMTNDADYGYMIWDQQSKGTLYDIMGLTEQEKLVVVYLPAVHRTVKIAAFDDMERLIAACPVEIKRLYRKLLPNTDQISLDA